MSDPVIEVERAGDDASFEAWYLQTYERLARSMAVVFANIDTGREIADEAMMKAFGRWTKADRPDNPDAWVFTVAINEGRRRWRRRRREAAHFAESALTAKAVAALDESDLDLWRAVAELPPRSREAIVLRYIADLTEADVAIAMGVETGSASALLVKARRSLKDTLSEDEADV